MLLGRAFVLLGYYRWGVMKAFLEHFAAVVGAFTVVILTMSWAHEYGYFWSVGRQFQTFLTTTDYLTNSALWMPFALFIIYNSIDWWRFGDEGPPKWEWKKKSTWVMLFLGIIFFLTWTIAARWPLPLASVILTFAWVNIGWSYLYQGYLARFVVDESFQGMLTQAVRFGPLLLIGMFLYGSVDANEDLTKTSDPYLFTYKGEAEPKLAIFLRNFDKGVLIRDAVKSRVEFRKWDEISSIGLPVAVPSRSIWCWSTGWLCGKTPQAITP